MSDKNLSDLCITKETVNLNLDEMLKIFGEEIKDKGVEMMGCYKCDGYNTKCAGYISKKEVQLTE